MNHVELDVLGTPAPKGSSRAMLRGGHAVNVPSGSDANKAKLASWDVAVREAALKVVGVRAAPVFDCPIGVAIVFRFPRLAGHFYKTKKRKGELRDDAPVFQSTKPDGDKLERSTWDSLTAVIKNDSHVALFLGEKVYTRAGREGAWIFVMPIDTTLDAMRLIQIFGAHVHSLGEPISLPARPLVGVDASGRVSPAPVPPWLAGAATLIDEVAPRDAVAPANESLSRVPARFKPSLERDPYLDGILRAGAPTAGEDF